MNITFYATIVFLHVVSAILSTGPLFIIIPLINRLRRMILAEEEIYLSLIQVIVRVVMHAGHVLVVTGVLLILFGPWPWHTSWVVMTIIVMGISGVFLATAFTRVLRRFHETGLDKLYILYRLKRTTWIYIGLMMIMLWLMVQKPMFW